MLDFSMPCYNKITAFFLLLFLNNYVYAKVRIKDLGKYYYNINLAELAIVDSNLSSAQEYYTKAFNTSYSFPVDIYNAFRVSYSQRDTVSSMKYFKELALLGQNSNKLYKYINDTASESYFNYITKGYNSIRSGVLKSQKPFLAKKLDAIYNIDQNCRTGPPKDDSTLNICDKEVWRQLYLYIDSFGFPSSQKVGIMEEGIIQAPNFGIFDLALWHQRGIINFKIYNLAYNAVMNGEYETERFAVYADYPSEKYCVFLPNHPISKEELKEIDKRRKELYLEPLMDYYKKLKYQTKMKDNMIYHLVYIWAWAYNYTAELKIIE